MGPTHEGGLMVPFHGLPQGWGSSISNWLPLDLRETSLSEANCSQCGTKIAQYKLHWPTISIEPRFDLFERSKSMKLTHLPTHDPSD